MGSYQRIRKVITGEPVDHLPAQPVIMMFAAKHAGIKYIDYTKDGHLMAKAQLKLVEDFGVDCLLTCSDPAREVIDIAGEGSVLWYEDQGPAINEEKAALTEKARLRTFRVPDPLAPGRMFDRIRSIEMMRREAGPDVSIVGWVEGPLALAAELRGVNNVMLDMIDDPAFVHDLMDFTAEVAIPYAEAQIQAGADTIGMSDAAACMMGLDRYETFLHPRQHRVLESIKSRHPGVVTRLHMCGKTDPLVARMGQLPADIIELDYPTALAPARQVLGPQRVILGNVSTITDLLEGTPEQVYEAARSCHQICGRYHVVGSGCEVSPATPPENLRALLAYAREHKPDAYVLEGEG
jgi:MtaA/CmuA family methyltransferase